MPCTDLSARSGARGARIGLRGTTKQRRRICHYAAQQLAAEVIRSHELPTPLVWIEPWPKDTTRGGEETFELVVFSSYEVEERAPYLGETRARIGTATWKRLDRAAVEVWWERRCRGSVWLARSLAYS